MEPCKPTPRMAVVAGVTALVIAASVISVSLAAKGPEPDAAAQAPVAPSVRADTASVDQPLTALEPDGPGSQWAVDVAALVDTLRASHPGQLATATIDDQAARRATITFVGAIPADVPSHEGVTFVADGGYSQAEAADTLHGVSEALHAALSPTGTPVSVGYYEAEARIVATVGSPRPAHAGSPAEAAEEAAETARAVLATIAVPDGIALEVISDPELEPAGG